MSPQPSSNDVDLDEAIAESFPASDPPAFSGLHLGPPIHREDAPAPTRTRGPGRALAMSGAALVGLATALILGRRKPKRRRWPWR